MANRADEQTDRETRSNIGGANLIATALRSTHESMNVKRSFKEGKCVNAMKNVVTHFLLIDQLDQISG